MIYIPYYNALALPDVSCYFQLDYLNGQSDQPVSAGDKVLFLMLKNEKQEGEIEAEDIFPIAVRGVVESIKERAVPENAGGHAPDLPGQPVDGGNQKSDAPVEKYERDRHVHVPHAADQQ